MIYLIALALSVAAYGIYQRFQSRGSLLLLFDVVTAAVSGWLSGLLLGLGARIGMWAVPFFNGTESRFSLDGTLNVVLTFSLFGIGLVFSTSLFFANYLFSVDCSSALPFLS